MRRYPEDLRYYDSRVHNPQRCDDRLGNILRALDYPISTVVDEIGCLFALAGLCAAAYILLVLA